jgi:hypothetical protein
MYYYLVSTRHDWVLHKKGCDSLYREKNKLFIGTLYTDHQAVGIAKQRVSEFSLCQYCISKHEHGQFRDGMFVDQGELPF